MKPSNLCGAVYTIDGVIQRCVRPPHSDEHWIRPVIRLDSTAERCVMGAERCPCGGGMRTPLLLYCDVCGASVCVDCKRPVGPDGYCDPCASKAVAEAKVDRGGDFDGSWDLE